ncbi:S41 family peptidase [Salinarimonas sp. NSM]|uniref:S41 family peptidase n=1 Tax=Salinarimonas sp. NSM TaxID=3458003 RepID=UPI0040359A99
MKGSFVRRAVTSIATAPTAAAFVLLSWPALAQPVADVSRSDSEMLAQAVGADTGVRATADSEALRQLRELRSARDAYMARRRERGSTPALGEVHWSVRNRVAYLHISSLDWGTYELVLPALDQIIDRGLDDGLAGILLDLRGTTGADAEAAIALADDFLERGEIASFEVPYAAHRQRFNARRGGPLEDRPMVVLVNADTGRAAQLVARAFHDLEAATVMGESPLASGQIVLFDTRIVNAFTPVGTHIDRTWKPDIVVPGPRSGFEPGLREDPASDDPQVRAAVDLLLQN